MTIKPEHDGKLTLSTSTWITLCALIAGGIAANLGLIHTQSNNLQTRIDNLDDKWQERIVKIQAELRSDLRTLETKIPPDWFRQMVERNTDRIDKLHNSFDDHLRDHP